MRLVHQVAARRVRRDGCGLARSLAVVPGVGGAVEGAGVKVPVITGAGRQVAAGLIGLLMVVVGLTSRWLPFARSGLEALKDWREGRTARQARRPDVGVAPQASDHFIGRGAELRWVRQELIKGQRVVLSGLGGIGRTQLALQYLLRYRASYRQGTFWLRGEEAAVFDGDLASLADFLELPQRGQPDQEVVIAGVGRWLVHHDKYLLVIDNLDEEAWTWSSSGCLRSCPAPGVLLLVATRGNVRDRQTASPIWDSEGHRRGIAFTVAALVQQALHAARHPSMSAG